MSRLVPTRPLSRMKRIHFDMSLTLDQTEPAGAIASVLRIGTTIPVSPDGACGVATFGLPMMPETSGSVSVMPSGAKMGLRMNASHDMPDTFSMMAPPMAYVTFWYSIVERNDVVGFT